MELSGFGSPILGNSSVAGALLVNGVAIAAVGTSYNTAVATPATANVNQLVVGADPAATLGAFENYYNGILDDVRVFFWGNNTNQLGTDLLPGGTNNAVGDLDADGQNWGRLNLNVDNDWIVGEIERLRVLAGAASIPSTDLNFDGQVTGVDTTIFLANWRKRNLVGGVQGGVQIGDWNSRKNGNFNYDGITDIRDAFSLHKALISGTGTGLDFNALGRSAVPEPTTGALLIAGIFAVTATMSRRRSR